MNAGWPNSPSNTLHININDMEYSLVYLAKAVILMGFEANNSVELNFEVKVIQLWGRDKSVKWNDYLVFCCHGKFSPMQQHFSKPHSLCGPRAQTAMLKQEGKGFPNS